MKEEIPGWADTVSACVDQVRGIVGMHLFLTIASFCAFAKLLIHPSEEVVHSRITLKHFLGRAVSMASS
jgi:hypothetical protein